MKKFTILLVFFVALLTTQLSAQGYKSSVGLRLGIPTSISYKQFLNQKGAIEVLGGYRGYSFYNFFNLAALYEHHMGEIKGIQGLNWFVGVGGAAYFYSYESLYSGDNSSKTSFGVLGTIGLDYKFKDYPINVSLDWMPVFILNGFYKGFDAQSYALSVRYVLN